MAQLNFKRIERPESLKDLAYVRIKGLLSSGQLEPLTLYSANQFAETLGVSRTPVREALLQLASEGFLLFVEGRGFTIRSYTPKEIRDFFEARRVIEAYVAEQLAGSFPPAELDRLEENLKLMEGHAARKDATAFLDADTDFHLSMVCCHDNALLVSVMENIRNHICVLGLTAVSFEGRYHEVIREHGAILRAFRERNRQNVVQAVLAHLAATERYVLGKPEATS